MDFLEDRLKMPLNRKSFYFLQLYRASVPSIQLPLIFIACFTQNSTLTTQSVRIRPRRCRGCLPVIPFCDSPNSLQFFQILHSVSYKRSLCYEFPCLYRKRFSSKNVTIWLFLYFYGHLTN